jgi:hypothetical protein
LLLFEAIGSFDWRAFRSDSRESWFYRILRREAESIMLPTVPPLGPGYLPGAGDGTKIKRR